MIPIDTDEAQRAYHDRKIRMNDLTFLLEIKAQDYITERQYKYIDDLAIKALPYQIIKATTFKAPVDPYYNDQYFKGDY